MTHQKSLALLSALGLLILPTATAFGQSHVGHDAMTLLEWSTRVSDRISDAMVYPAMPFRGDMPHGIVRIKFGCSDSGAPSDITIYKSSGNKLLDNAALRAIRHVSSLHPLASGMTNQQHYVAALLFASDQADADTQMKRLRKEVEQDNAWFSKRASTLAMSISVLPPG